MVMFFFGIGFLIAAVALFFVQRHQKQKVFSIKAARSVSTAELMDTASAVAEEIGGGSWRDYVKLWGEVHTDHPLTSELKQQPCVYYTAKVTREYERTVTRRDADGNLETSQERGSEVISSNNQSVPFMLRDRAGTIEVNPEGADIETIQVLNEFRRGDPTGNTISFGPVTFNVSSGGQGRTLGYRYCESILPVGRNILVVGAASDLTGQIVISKPVKSDRKYVISLKDEETLAANISRNAKITFFSMVGCGGAGVLLIILGLLI